ncbi:MAG TPA: P-loop NTPase fold protein, partial [Thermoanaerobaculia bacterium]
KRFVTTEQPFTVALSRSERLVYQRTSADALISMRGSASVDSPQLRALEAFNDHKHAIALGDHGQIFVTADGQSLRRSTLPYGLINAIHADVSGKRLWSAGTAGSLLASADGGATWKPLEGAGAQDFQAIAFTDSGTRGWAAGNEGAMVQTDDGGRSWRRVTPANPKGYEDSFADVISSGDGMRVKVALGDAQYPSPYAIESSDGGNTWSDWPDTSAASRFYQSGFFTGIDDQWTITSGPDPSSMFKRFGSNAAGPPTTIPTLARSIVAIGECGWVRKDSFPSYRSTDGGRTWQPTNAPQDVRISDVRFLDGNHGFAETEDGKKFETNDGGTSWQPILNDPSSWSVRPLIANKDGKRMWTASIDGIPLRSLDGGKTWMAPQYRRFPAPWYYLTFAPVALLLFVSMRKSVPVVRNSIEDVPWNDRPLTEPAADRLDYRPLAAGIARFFGNPGTELPLTIAITGPWGSGKSSLMNLVADAVKRYDYRPVWFNAWHYQSEEFLLPAVLESLRTEAVPRFWTLHGLQFRMRLLVLRGMKNWLPALVIMAVLVTTAAYFMRDHDAFRQLVENFRNLGTEKSDKFFQSAGLVISSLLSIIIVFRSLNAFGVSGTKVAALLSGSVRLADAGGQTGFRHRFARAFGEVTRALGRNRLVLFIDDLDRCRPDHVLSVLECINFLVTSGDCFIITGMDRPRVERCVAMRFEEESKNIGADENADGENDPVTPVRYAQLYLEKLINIEVPVPVAASSRSRELFAGDRKEAREERVRATVFGERLVAFGQAAIPWVVGAAVLASAAYVGYTVLPDRYPQQRPAQTIVVTAPAAAPKSPVAIAPTGTPSQPSPEKQPDFQIPTRFVRPIMASRREVLPIIGIVLIVIFGIVRLSIERAKLEQDSKDFRTALRQWHPLLYAANATPRSMKRCVNRVRYYAMRQRTNPLPPTLPERLVRLVHRLRRLAPLQDDAALAIPENILVPVSVVQHVYPKWLEDDAFWRDPAAYIEAHNPLAELADGIAALREHGSIEGYRSAFRQISAGIHVAGTADGRRIPDPVSGTAS